MVTVNDLTGDLETAVVEHAGHDIQIRYRPDAVTPRIQSRIYKANRAIEKARKRDEIPDADIAPLLVETVCRCVAEWDVTDGNGGMWPLDPEHVEQLPTTFLDAVIGAVFAAEKEPLDEGEGGTSAA